MKDFYYYHKSGVAYTLTAILRAPNKQAAENYAYKCYGNCGGHILIKDKQVDGLNWDNGPVKTLIPDQSGNYRGIA